jgi:hypothetical protein
MPGRLLSDNPAIEGASTKAKANMKLRVRIGLSGFGTGVSRRFRCQLDNHPLFSGCLRPSGKWFGGTGDLFRRQG